MHQEDQPLKKNDQNNISEDEDMDDSFLDPDYFISSDSSDSDDSVIRTSNDENASSSHCNSFDVSLESTGNTVPDDRDLSVEVSIGAKSQRKYNFCFFCNKMQTKIARHLEDVHKTEEMVKKFSVLPKGSTERKNIIATLRKNGNFKYNTDKSFNKGQLLVCRRPKPSWKRSAGQFLPCAICKGFFASNNLRHHVKSCGKDKLKSGERVVKVLGKKILGRIHPVACKRLRNNIFPVLRENSVITNIRYDELIIRYGNKMCTKYKPQHQEEMIRARIRLLGRLLSEVQRIKSNITDFSSMYAPEHYDTFVEGVYAVAGLDEDTGMYRAPSVASTIGTLVKQVGAIYISECIKKKETEKKLAAEDFLKLLTEDYGISINRAVQETQSYRKRQKKIVLPLKSDIYRLFKFLSDERNKAFAELNNKYSFQVWLRLAETCLSSVQLFNRRRAGEIERMMIEDIENVQHLNDVENHDEFQTLSEKHRKLVQKYVRLTIRGKLGRTVPVLLTCRMHECLKLVIHYRKRARVPMKNPYVFGLPGVLKNRYRYLRACILMRKFSGECGAQIPFALRGTELRKHIATLCVTFNLNEDEVQDLADFMGHEKKIHTQIYRQSIFSREVLRMSKLLQVAQGNETDDNGSSEESDEVEETDCKRKGDGDNIADSECMHRGNCSPILKLYET